jgi:hypothetical protein
MLRPHFVRLSLSEAIAENMQRRAIAASASVLSIAMLMLAGVPSATSFLMQPSLISHMNKQAISSQTSFRVHHPATRWSMNADSHGKTFDANAGMMSPDRPISAIQPGMISAEQGVIAFLYLMMNASVCPKKNDSKTDPWTSPSSLLLISQSHSHSSIVAHDDDIFFPKKQESPRNVEKNFYNTIV